ncbi:MAG TPA: hypothetical protein VGR35_21545 [Tepidisphaeraceae bacterium]|nr:hypothetical protein [Tepidisphaeraceae bacterium]
MTTVHMYPKPEVPREVAAQIHSYVRIQWPSHADLAMLFCGDPLRRFYAVCGWEPLDSARIRHGHRAAPTAHADNLVMMRFISAKARAARASWEREPVYVGERTW